MAILLATEDFQGLMYTSTNQNEDHNNTHPQSSFQFKMEMRLVICILFCTVLHITPAKKFKGDKPEWAKKDIRDFNDADLERLFDQWEEDEEPLEPDELPEHLRPQPNIVLSNLDTSHPENLLKISKKGKTLMMFVLTTDDLTREETETVTKLWQMGLWNNHIQVERYLLDDNRAMFLFRDGSLAWEAKDFLVEQEKCKEVTIENKSYRGKHVTENIKKRENVLNEEL